MSQVSCHVESRGVLLFAWLVFFKESRRNRGLLEERPEKGNGCVRRHDHSMWYAPVEMVE